MIRFIVAFVLLCCAVSCVDALEGRPLYDYMIAFMTTNWDSDQYQKAIESILNSPQWKTLDAQYGPWTVPPPPTQLRREGRTNKKME